MLGSRLGAGAARKAKSSADTGSGRPGAASAALGADPAGDWRRASTPAVKQRINASARTAAQIVFMPASLRQEVEFPVRENSGQTADAEARGEGDSRTEPTG